MRFSFLTLFIAIPTVIAAPIQKRLDGSNGDSAYVDIYKCKSHPLINAHTEDDVGKVPYGCKYDALAHYYINIGWEAHNNLSWLVDNNETFNKNYGAFIKMFQGDLEEGFLDFLKNGDPFRFYSCKGSTSDYEPCTSHGFTDYPGGRKVKRSDCILGYHDLDLIPEKIDDFLDALEPYVKTKLSRDSVGKVKHHFDGVLGPAATCAFQSYSNVDMPLAVNLDPNPMQFITKGNVTDLNKLLRSVEDYFDRTSGPDLIDSLVPTPIYFNMSTSITQLNDLGKEIKKEEEKKKALLIVSLVFGLAGAGCFFLGPLEGAVMGAILAMGQMMAQYAITGDLSVGDIILGVFGCFEGIFQVAKAGALIKDASTVFRMVKTAETMTQMSQFTEFINPRLSLFNLKV